MLNLNLRIEQNHSFTHRRSILASQKFLRMTEKWNCWISHCSSVHTWLNETKAWRNTVIIIIIEVKGDSFLTHLTHLTGSVILAFPVHAHPSPNEFMKAFSGRSRMTCPCHLAAGTEGSLQGPAEPRPSPWLWMGVQSMARYGLVWLQYTSWISFVFFFRIQSKVWDTCSGMGHKVSQHLHDMFTEGRYIWCDARKPIMVSGHVTVASLTVGPSV